jgi:hypothetical protein
MTEFLYNEARSILLGNRLGEGMSREVFELRTNPAYVIKIETRGQSFQNAAEWETWNWVNGGPLAKWFAPCEFISSCGVLLIQRKVAPLRDSELPARVPAFLCDLKIENFGLLNGKFVCCDYGTVPSAIRLVAKRMHRAKWR